VRFLVIAKTYPTPQRDLAKLETVCTGAIGEDGKIYRLYPISFRLLGIESTFSKFEWIEADVQKNDKDARPESYIPERSSLKALRQKVEDPVQRIKFLLPYLVPTLNDLKVLGTDARTLAVCRMLEPKWTWVENPMHGKHVDLQKFHAGSLFMTEDIEIMQQLYIPRRHLQVSWKDERDNKHKHRLLEWEYYTLLSKLLRERHSEGEAEDMVLQQAMSQRFRTDGYELWGLFGTTLKDHVWILGSLFNFKIRDIQLAKQPDLFAP